MRLYKLNETVLTVKGNAAKFLNGLTSNDLDKPFNAFLNQHGRIVATFYQEKISEEEFLIAVPVVALEGLLKHLERYAKISGVRIEPAALKAYVDLDTTKILFKSEEITSAVFQEKFTLFRLQKNMPLLGVDYQLDEFLLNIDEVTFVSFTKGCFLGQEPVSKVHSRSKPTRKLVVKYEDECSDEEKRQITSKILEPSTGRVRGFVFVKNV